MKFVRDTWKLPFPWWSVLFTFSPPLRTRLVGQVLFLYNKVEFQFYLQNNYIYPVALKDGEGDTVVQSRKQKLNLENK